jgi:hypothetical protein
LPAEVGRHWDYLILIISIYSPPSRAVSVVEKNGHKWPLGTSNITT